MTIHDPDSDKFVPESEVNDAVSTIEVCPGCGEKDAERFDFVDDDHVKCTTCGLIFSPNA